MGLQAHIHVNRIDIECQKLSLGSYFEFCVMIGLVNGQLASCCLTMAVHIAN